MKYKRDTKEYKLKREQFINLLVEEAASGITKMDTLDETGRCLFCGEAEAMYFKAIRNFFENSISKRIMTINQDIPKTKQKTRENNF